MQARQPDSMGPPDEDLELALGGDALVTRRYPRTDPPGPVVETVRAADTGVVNLEVLLHDYEGYPAAKGGGTYVRAPPAVADDLAWMGFGLFAAATNHAGDYSHGGMEATMDALEARDLPFAGLGRTLGAAREPAYLDTQAGRVALVAACSWFPPASAAGQQRPDIHGRPGIAPLGVDTRYVVPEATLGELSTLGDRLGLEDRKDFRRERGFPVPAEDDDEYVLPNVGGDEPIRFAAGDEFAVRQSADPDDLAALRQSVRTARRQADWVVASLHTHEGHNGMYNDSSVPEFLESVAHDCVDAGADVVLGHGPHVLRGVEVYDGSPVFYSLGNLFMQNETAGRQPADIYERYDLDPLRATPAELYDARVLDDDGKRIGFLADRTYWEGVLPVCRFRDGELADVVLHPLDLGFDRPRTQRGTPRAASDSAARIIERVADLSAPYDTTVAVDGDVGRVETA